MKPISHLITSFIEKTVESKGLSLYITPDGKYLAMDKEHNTAIKFDFMYSDNDFSCQVLVSSDNGLHLKHSVNIPWTNGAAIRDFMEQIKEL